MGFYTDELEKCKNEDYVLCTQKIEIEREKYWMKKADQSFDQRTDSFYKISIPGIWKGNMRDFCGTVLLEKKFFITEEQVVTPAEILMGAFTDADKIYINGICCGSSYDRYASRIYPVAPGILRAGENVACIHLYSVAEEEQCQENNMEYDSKRGKKDGLICLEHGMHRLENKWNICRKRHFSIIWHQLCLMV